jgi:hypothetical protein
MRQRVEPGDQGGTVGSIFGQLAQAQALGVEPPRDDSENGQIRDRPALLERHFRVPLGKPQLGALEELIGWRAAGRAPPAASA